MQPHIFFYLGVALITLHEMDAIRCKEWQIFPGLSLLSDKLGYPVFVFAHLPLFFVIYRQLAHGSNPEVFMQGFNIFLMVHVGLHLLFLKHQKNEFRDGVSWTIIVGAGVCALLDLLF